VFLLQSLSASEIIWDVDAKWMDVGDSMSHCNLAISPSTQRPSLDLEGVNFDLAPEPRERVLGLNDGFLGFLTSLDQL